MAEPAHPRRSREAFFGRIKGQKLTARQAGLVEGLLPRLAIDVAAPAPPDLAGLFGGGIGEVRLEIGFGGGEHLLHEAARFPQTGFIGVEPFVNGMAKLLAALDEDGPANIRLYADDATRLLDWLPAASLSGIDLFYPDPWPKKRHWKRRFVSKVNLDRFARVLKPGAPFRFASDIDTYVEWTLEHCHEHPAFALRNAAGQETPFEAWPGTRYEAKAIREGRRPAYLLFERIPNA